MTALIIPWEAMISVFYWVVALAWLAVFLLLATHANAFFRKSPVLSFICIVLAIDAIRTVIENIYFGIFFNAYFGTLPAWLLDYGDDPAFLFAIKFITFASAVVMFFLLRRLLPAEIAVGKMLAAKGKAEALNTLSRRLEEEHQSLSMAQAVAKIGSWDFDVRTNALNWSAENYRIHGVEPGAFEPSRAALGNLLAEQDRLTRERHFDQSLATGQPAILEYSLTLPDGQARHVEERWQVVTDPAGNALRVIGTCQDMTDHRKAQEKLGRSGALLQIAGKMARIGGWSVRATDKKLVWTDEIFDIVEYPVSEEPPLETALALYPPAGRDMLANAIDACMTHATPFDMELEINTALGNRRDVRCFGQAEFDAQGNIIGVNGAFQDISRIKGAEQALSETTERLRLLSRASNDAIWDWNLASGSAWTNNGFRTLFGYEPDELPNTLEARAALIDPEDRERVTSSLKKAMAGSAETWSETFRFMRRDGSYAHVDDRGSLIRNAGGEVIRIVGGMTDVTTKVQLEAQLRQAQRLDSLGQLTGGVAHDFNNLLTVILGGAESLVESMPDEPRRQAVAQMVLDAAIRGAELTQHLLAFSRQQPLLPKVLDVGELVVGMEPLLQRALGEKIDIRMRCGAALWAAHVDSGQLQNALLNLCLNARDAMPEGGAIMIETANQQLDADHGSRLGDVIPGDYVMLSVSDTGAGIPPELLPRVFEPFFTTKEVGKGTGLGLSMVYGFVKQSNGHVHIYSEPGQGTTLKIYLPRHLAQAEPDEATPAAVGQTGGNETILMVEDDAIVRRYVYDRLGHLGYRVIVAENGAEALDVVRSGVEIDLLFTDLVMPVMDGRTLADEASKVRPGLRVLFTSGYTENTITHKDRLQPGVPLLMKPYAFAGLASKIRDVLDS